MAAHHRGRLTSHQKLMRNPADPDPDELRPRLTARTERERLPVPPLESRAARRQTLRTFHRTPGLPGVRRFAPRQGLQRSVTVKLGKFGAGATTGQNLTVHLRYLAREGAGWGGESARLFGPESDDVDRRAFAARCRRDPGHYRLMVEPGDDCPVPDIREFGRRFMADLELDRGVKLEWVAADHHDTGRPHLHIVLRSRSADGRRVSLGAGSADRLRTRARELATELLGPLPERVRPYEARKDRFTSADRILLECAVDGQLDISRAPDHWRATILRRLSYLEDRGWIAPGGPRTWTVPSDLRLTLLKVHRERCRSYSAARILRNSDWRDQAVRVVPAELAPGERFVGGFVGVEAFTPRRTGMHCVVLDGVDGRLAHFEMRAASSVMCLDRVRPGAVIEVAGEARGVRPADRLIGEVAATRDGIWSMSDHAQVRPSDWPRFIRMHQARLESVSLDGACRALGDGRFEIPADYCERALRADLAKWGPADHQARVLDDRPLDEQIRAPGLTWLDRLMISEERPRLAGPFGDQVAEALPEREKRLRMTGLGSGDPLVLSPADVRKLHAMELRSVMEPLGKTGRAVFLTKDGQQAAGQYVTRVHISGSPHAVLEGPSAFHLVVWKPGMEAARGRWIEAVVRDGRSEFRTVRNAMRQFGLG